MKFMAIDTGKTKTIAMLFDKNLDVLCSVAGDPADITLDPDVVKGNIDKVVRKCFELSGLSFKDIDLVVFSWAGLDTKKDFDIAWSYVKELGYPIEKIVIEHDAVTAFYAVTWGEPGIAIIAGTGAIAFGMDKKGRRARSSGWGWLIGDEGSASWIALQALNAASRAYDGRDRYTSLVERIKNFFGVNDLLDIVTIVYRIKPFDIGKIAAIAVLVDEEAEKGDEIAMEIMNKAGLELALAVYNVAQKLNMVDEEIIVGGVGSVFKSKIVRKVFEENVRKMLKKAILRDPIIGYKAIIGPVIIALKRFGVGINRDVVNLIEERVNKAEKNIVTV